MATGVQGLIRRVRFGSAIIVVSGLPRSGTSMAMKMLDAAGVEIVQDGLRTADVDNPKGYFEDERVKDLDKNEDRSWLRAARGKAIKIVAPLLPYLPESNNYKVVFINRDLREVLRSQEKMLARRDEDSPTDDDRMRELYEGHLEKVRFVVQRRPCFEVLELTHRDVLERPIENAERLNVFLGGSLDVQAMAAVVDTNLYRNRAT